MTRSRVVAQRLITEVAAASKDDACASGSDSIQLPTKASGFIGRLREGVFQTLFMKVGGLMRIKSIAAACAALTALFSTSASANIVYSVDLISGTTSVVGQITTDGHTGTPLGQGDIVGINVVISNSAGSTTLTALVAIQRYTEVGLLGSRAMIGEVEALLDQSVDVG